MTKYQEIISSLQNADPAKAEYFEEEINIIIHKLKFLTADNFPKTIVLDQQQHFHPLTSSSLVEKVKIAGGRWITEWVDNPDCIIIVQSNESLYGQLADFLTNPNVTATNAYQLNNIYIIQNINFDENDSTYLRDTEVLAEILQPKYFIYGHDGSSWVKFDVQ